MIQRSVSTFVLAFATCALVAILALALFTPRWAPRVKGTPDTDTLAMFPATSTTGQMSGQLPSGKLTLTSALSVDLTHDLARLPLHEGFYQGTPVWYVITDISDARLARQLGLNYAPKLAHVGDGCPACVQEIVSASPTLGSSPVTFVGVPNFSMKRSLSLAGGGFPPASYEPGAVGGPGYSQYVRVRGMSVVYDAPIIATGAGPFDVVTHTNTHDRVLALDTRAKTVDILLSRGYAGGQPIVYFTFEASDPLIATLDRATFVPALSGAPYANGSIPLTADLEQDEYVPGVKLTTDPSAPATSFDVSGSARAEVFSFENGPHDSPSRTGQGLAHLVSDGQAGQDASLQDAALLTALRQGGDAQDVFAFYPTLRDPRLAGQYSPVGDLNIAEWTTIALAHGLNTTRTDAIEIEELAQDRILTAPGGWSLAASGVVVNCPALGFTGVAPEVP